MPHKAKCWEFNMQREYLLVLNTNIHLNMSLKNWHSSITYLGIKKKKNNYGTFYNLCVMDRII